MKLTGEVISFFKRQGYIIFSTVDEGGRPHSVAKGIVDIDGDGVVCLLDLYRGKTYENLRENVNASVTAIDEHEFAGYTLKGKARIVERDSLDEAIRQRWKKLLRTRISQRIVKNVQSEIGGNRPHEAHLPSPEYVIVFKSEEVVDLSHRRGGGSG